MYRVGSALLSNFRPDEFKLPGAMDPIFLLFLDSVRSRCPLQLAFELHSDARTAEHNAEIGGVPTSLHLFDPSDEKVKARAVDFSIPAFKAHVSPWTEFSNIAEAVFDVWHEQKLSCGYELEFQYGEKNKHVHLGLFREPGHASHLVVKADLDVHP